ncbi:MAG TPA: hypothetical protein VF418_09165 [Sphingomonadaceae bacterium]
MTPEFFAWSHANFSFVIDGKYDMMSLNPLEMTNFEMMGTIFGFAGLIITFIRSRSAAKRQKPHVFTSQETDEDAIY